jgi:hypothetical protein
MLVDVVDALLEERRPQIAEEVCVYFDRRVLAEGAFSIVV